MLFNYYLNKLNYQNIPIFLKKYLKCSSLKRLKKVGYFCGMDYASKDVYDFKEYISRFDHSLSTCLLTYKLTHNKTMSIAALFHDIATPCFSHVIDYMNGDYSKQESTEEYTEYIIKNDKYLLKCLKEDNINILDIINFKKYSIVDNQRPKLCVDRLDGIILPGIAWTKSIKQNDIDIILDNLIIYKNENNEDEIGFKDINIAKKVLKISNDIDILCHSNEDNYMMSLLASITKYIIDNNYLKYEDLYFFEEDKLFNLFKSINDFYFNDLLNKFMNVKKEDIPLTKLDNVKIRDLNPLVNNIRLKEIL